MLDSNQWEPERKACRLVWIRRSTDGMEGLGCMNYVRAHRKLASSEKYQVCIFVSRKVTFAQAKMLLQVSGADQSGALWSCFSDCRLYKLRHE